MTAMIVLDHYSVTGHPWVGFDDAPQDHMGHQIYFGEIIRWCIDQFGQEGPGHPNDRWTEYQGRFTFRDEQDRMLFVLRWS